MKLPTFPEQNYAMQLVASALVELFPKLQLLDLAVLPDRFCVDFSFSRELSKEELILVKNRFFEKVKRSEKGEIREMVSRNACDLLKHHKQMLLTGLVDREEQFTEMFCMDLYNAPLIGEINQERCDVKDLKLSLYDNGPKKWNKFKVHHYSLESFIYYSTEDRKVADVSEESGDDRDHTLIGVDEGLFWVDSEGVYFSSKGEESFESFVTAAKKYFGNRVFIEGDEKLFAFKSGEKDFFVTDVIDADDLSDFYGLKGAAFQRSIICYSFSDNDLKRELAKYCRELGVDGSFNEMDEFIVYDYRGVPWSVAEFDEINNYLTLEINLQRLFALSLENETK